MIAPDAWLSHLREQLPRVHDGNDPEGVHQLRVAAGRLSVWLQLGRRRMLRDDLCALRRSASRVRDLDVVLDSAGERGAVTDPAGATDSTGAFPADWLRALRGERAERARALASRLSEPRVDALLFALSISPPVDEDTAHAVVRKLERRVSAAGHRLIAESGDPHALHRLRRALRRLRYAREWLGQEADELKRLQDELGDINDLAARIRLIDESAMRPALEGLRSKTEHEIRVGAERAIQTWRRIESRMRS